MLAYLQGNAGAALEPLVAALKQRPEDEVAYGYLGASYERIGDQDSALKAYRQACEKAPQQVLPWVNFGSALTRSGWYEHAAAILQHALKMDPDQRHARELLAATLGQDGQVDAATSEYRRLLAAQPASGNAWWGLALLRPMPLGPEDINELRVQLARAEIRNPDRAAMCFALAHALESEGDPAGAFEALGKGHELARVDHEPWDAAAARALARSCLDSVPAPEVAQADGPGREVIFIVSLPRAGSTLVEQVLASHSQVAGTAELTDLPQVLLEKSAQCGEAYPDWTASMTPADWQALGQRYLVRTVRWRQKHPRMTDKLPGNWLHVGSILSMLPNARVVAVHRDPLENCLACYRMKLDGHDYAHQFVDLAEYQCQFELMVREWQRRCPQRVRVQSYEELTRDPERQIRELLHFCELPFEQACVDFHLTRRRVSTLSTSQVREPIHRARPRAEMYGNLLDPLRDAIAQARERGIDRKPAS